MANAIQLQLLYAAGFLFMSATEEQMALVNNSGIDHVAYVLIIYSLAFLLFLFTNVLVHLYDRSANQDAFPKGINGHMHAGNGHAMGSQAEERRLRDAEEFELDDMMSDEEDEEHAQRRKLLKEEDGEKDEGENEGLSSPSTVGRNNDRVA